jgi:hypothetical protein
MGEGCGPEEEEPTFMGEGCGPEEEGRDLHG